MERMNTTEEEQCKRNKEAFKRFYEHIPRTALMGVLTFLLHDTLSKYEKDPSKPYSNAFAYASVGYVVFQVAHAFARVNHPTSLVFDILSLLCAFAAVIIAFTAIFHL